jgi:hypothetical protein
MPLEFVDSIRSLFSIFACEESFFGLLEQTARRVYDKHLPNVQRVNFHVEG